MHWARWRRNGDVGGAEPIASTNGSGYTDSRGYRRISVDGKRTLEHRVVMEKKLGRKLLPGETVHHKGARDDNRDHMLELRVASHQHGLSVEEAVAWAREILDRYDS